MAVTLEWIVNLVKSRLGGHREEKVNGLKNKLKRGKAMVLRRTRFRAQSARTGERGIDGERWSKERKKNSSLG